MVAAMPSTAIHTLLNKIKQYKTRFMMYVYTQASSGALLASNKAQVQRARWWLEHHVAALAPQSHVVLGTLGRTLSYDNHIAVPHRRRGSRLRALGCRCGIPRCLALGDRLRGRGRIQ
jgi:hypothetical protein